MEADSMTSALAVFCMANADAARSITGEGIASVLEVINIDDRFLCCLVSPFRCVRILRPHYTH
jgi:hypothetical protein